MYKLSDLLVILGEDDTSKENVTSEKDFEEFERIFNSLLEQEQETQ